MREGGSVRDFQNPDFSGDMLAIGARAGSLPSGARILSGLREDFLQGDGKLTIFCLFVFAV